MRYFDRLTAAAGALSDRPIVSSYEYGYHDLLGAFFSNFYGSAMKGNVFLGQALITGVQRVVKESIFSQFNNPQVYTVVDKEYASYFGLDRTEAETLLRDYGLEFSFVERESNYSLWGLLVNAGYLTVTEWVDNKSAVVKIPNDEVMAELKGEVLCVGVAHDKKRCEIASKVIEL